MASIAISKYIEAGPEKVFEKATDLQSAADWIRGIQRLEVLTPGPVGVGTLFTETRSTATGEVTVELEVTAFDPPKAYSVTCESHGFRFHCQFTLTPRGSGTELEMKLDAKPLTMTARLLSVASAQVMKTLAAEFASDLDDLEAAITGR